MTTREAAARDGPPLPAPTFLVTDQPVNLIASVGGGTWAGRGIMDAVNGVFSPSVAGSGRDTITYTITSGQGINTATTEIDVKVLIDGIIPPLDQWIILETQ